MKKQHKIIELRTAAKVKIAETESKLAFARNEAAGKRARLMRERAAELYGLEAGSTERFDVLAKYRAKLADVYEQLAATVAQLKYVISQTKIECEKQCAAAEDDPDPETEKKQPQQETVYCDGSEHSARIVARRIVNKMPHIPAGGFLHVHIVEDRFADNHEYFVGAWYGNDLGNVNTIFAPGKHTAEFEADFVEKARRMYDDKTESGGDPVEQVDNLIADTVESGKEGGNE